MKPLNDEAARRYIAGEEFDASEWERQHILSLIASGEQALKTAHSKVQAL